MSVLVVNGVGAQVAEVDARVAEVDARLAALERLEPGARNIAFAAVQGLAELYGEGLARIVGGLEHWSALRVGAYANGGGEVEVRGGGSFGEGAGELAEVSDPLASLLEDELVAHLLILHDLHPLDLAARVERALDETRPYLRSHGGDAEVVGIEGGVVRLRLIGSCRGCPGSALTLRDAVEEAIRRLAPEIERVEEEGANLKLVQLERRGA